MTQTQQQLQKCKVTYKGQRCEGLIISQIQDKIQVQILKKDGTELKKDWFEKKEVARQW